MAPASDRGSGILCRNYRLWKRPFPAGGHEETDSQAALAGAERIRLGIEGAFLAVPRPRPITVSVGVASYPDHAPNRVELVGAADRALHLSKRRGKGPARFAAGPG